MSVPFRACALLIASCLLSTAPPVRATGVGVIKAKLVSVHIEYGTPYLFFDLPIGNPDGCTAHNVVVLAGDLTNQQSYLSMAMTALAAGKPVSVWVDGCGWSPWNPSVPKVYAMQLVP